MTPADAVERISRGQLCAISYDAKKRATPAGNRTAQHFGVLSLPKFCLYPNNANGEAHLAQFPIVQERAVNHTPRCHPERSLPEIPPAALFPPCHPELVEIRV